MASKSISTIGRNNNICWECITSIDETPDIQSLIFKRYGDRSICININDSDCIYIKDNGAYFSVNDVEDIRNFLIEDEKLNRNEKERISNLAILESSDFWKILNDAIAKANTLTGFYHYGKIY